MIDALVSPVWVVVKWRGGPECIKAKSTEAICDVIYFIHVFVCLSLKELQKRGCVTVSSNRFYKWYSAK